MAAIAPLPKPTLGDNSLLDDMLSRPLVFSDPVPKNNYKFDVRMKEVLPGSRSPPPAFGRRVIGSGLVNGSSKARKESRGREEEQTRGRAQNDDEDADMDSESHRRLGHTSTTGESSSTTLSNGLPTSTATGTTVNGHGDRSARVNGTIHSPAKSAHQVSESSPMKAKLIAAAQPTPSSTSKSTSALTPTSTPTTARQVTPRASKNSHELYPAEVDLRWPDHLLKYKNPAAGLTNPSMACYANATLQVLLHTPPVLRIAMAHDERTCLRTKKNLFCMLCEVRNMAGEYHWVGKRRYSPPIHQKLKFIKKSFSKNRQEDTHEFFRFVTDGLQNTAFAGYPKETPEKIKHTSWVYRVWGGKVRSRVVCSRCKKPSDTFDDFLDLALDVNREGKKSIANMMAGFTKEDHLSGDNKYHCDNCKAKANATKSFRIEQAPPILTLHLKRFSINYNPHSGRARADKFNGFIEYPENLDIAPYMVDSMAGGTKYRLFGVTCHRGAELRFGHYTSYVKGPQGNWYSADDDEVNGARLNEVLSDKTAYLLSYIRVSDGQGLASSQTPSKSINGNSPMVNGVSQKRGRSPESDDESEEDDEEEQERTNILTARSNSRPRPNGSIGPLLPMTIRKGTPPRSHPSELNGHLDMNSRRQSGDDENEDEMPPELPKLGSLIKSPTTKGHVWAPKPINPGQFYSQTAKSPISRPHGPAPGQSSHHGSTRLPPGSSSSASRLSKKERKKLDKQGKKNKSRGGPPAPFKASTLNRGQSANNSKGVTKRMKGKF